MSEIRLAIIGGGKMGEALIKGLVTAKLLEPSDITVSDVDHARRSMLAKTHGVAVCARNAEAAAGKDIVLLAVKPQQIDDVLAELSSVIMTDQVVVSIAAGVSTQKIAGYLADGVPVVRAMPNTAAQIGKAMTVISPGAFAGEAAMETASRLLGAIGLVEAVDEELQNAAVAINGSGPAYFYLFAEALVESAVRHGLSRQVATALVIQTMAGAAGMLAETGKHPALLIDEVASPGGTTVAALEAFEAAGLRAAVSGAVDAAIKRASELG